MADAVQPSAGMHDPHAGHDDHHGHVAHHFETAEQQFDSSKLGMWLFLATEILLFGGLFCAYAVWRANHPEIFIAGQHHLDWKLGALNTVILLLSSFTMAWAVTCSQKRQPSRSEARSRTDIGRRTRLHGHQNDRIHRQGKSRVISGVRNTTQPGITATSPTVPKANRTAKTPIMAQQATAKVLRSSAIR